MVILELPFSSDAAARAALQRGAHRASARVLRDVLNYPGAALALELYVERMRSPRDVNDTELQPYDVEDAEASITDR